MSSAAAPIPSLPLVERPVKPRPNLLKSLTTGDGKYLLALLAFLLPGLYITLLHDSDKDPHALYPEGCFSLYWFTAYLTLALTTLIFLHSLVYYFPRPVSQVDASPITSIVVGIVFLGPIVFGAWTIWILYASNTRTQCDYSQHKALWTYFMTIAAVELLGLLMLCGMCCNIVFEVMRSKQGVAPGGNAPAGAGGAPNTTAGTFTSDTTANLDNGRWLTMESRRIKEEQKRQQ